MCFSATAFLDMLRLGKDFDAVVDSEAFARLYAQRLDHGVNKTPKAMDDAAIRLGGEIAGMVKEWRLRQSAEWAAAGTVRQGMGPPRIDRRTTE